MEIRVKLMGALRTHAPAGDVLDLKEGASIDDVLEILDVSPAHVQVVMVNSKPQPDRGKPLSPNDELTILPPVGGG